MKTLAPLKIKPLFDSRFVHRKKRIPRPLLSLFSIGIHGDGEKDGRGFSFFLPFFSYGHGHGHADWTKPSLPHAYSPFVFGWLPRKTFFPAHVPLYSNPSAPLERMQMLHMGSIRAPYPPFAFFLFKCSNGAYFFGLGEFCLRCKVNDIVERRAISTGEALFDRSCVGKEERTMQKQIQEEGGVSIYAGKEQTIVLIAASVPVAAPCSWSKRVVGA